MRADVIVVAAGKGERMGAALPKPFLPLLGVPLLVRTLRAVDCSALIRNILVVIAEERDVLCRELLDTYGPFRVPVTIVHGGAERQDSVRLGLAALDPDSQLVAIHDVARPFLTADLLDASIQTAAEYGAAVVAIPVQDTIKCVAETGLVINTVPRQGLWLSQTPQTFQVSLIREAHAQAFTTGVTATDDVALLEWHGKAVKVVSGSPRNFKITTSADLYLAEAILTAEAQKKQ